MKKTMLILICAVVIGMSAMTAAAEEREKSLDQSLQDETQTTEEPMLIAPGPDSEETGSETPLVIAPAGDSEPVASSNSVEKNDLLETTGIPILGMTCIIAVATMIIVIIYKKK
jgi:hypothetical protein